MATNPTTIEGVYRDGKIELLETQSDLDEALVTCNIHTGK